jgi:hypothetical protein
MREIYRILKDSSYFRVPSDDKLLLLLFIVYLTTLFQYLRLYSVYIGGKPAASAQFILNPDSSARAI